MGYIPFRIISALAEQEGFCAVGSCRIEKAEADFFDEWLDRGFHSSMSYMENYKEIRKDPSLLLCGAKSLISFLYSYNDERIDGDFAFKIAHYAQRKDYHYVIKSKLNNIISKLKEQYPFFEARVFTDSAPILERYWAEKCGLGRIGKSTLLINKDYGSKVFLSEIVSDFSTDYSSVSETEKMKSPCGKCRKCIDACPNGALSETLGLNAAKCISYQTIENKENIPAGLKTAEYIYGCDICTEVCPWNMKAKRTSVQDPQTKELIKLVLSKIEQNLTVDKSDFNLLKKKSPINRIKYGKFLSNIYSAGTEND
ncbi:MAG: tRNA epoxyqueuosine(34) reductase QueG [Bacteroidales bacterium]|nr:tRNA epoxyqueuosine(34) reductase QueG [Bacteroidales bacterium]